MSRVIRRPQANRDLVAIYQYLAREASLRTADRFFAATEATFLRLAGLPGLGTQYDLDDGTHADLRFLPVSRHRAYLVFYRPLTDGIEVLRVLHGARDLDGLLADEPAS